jgi:hypothetical protein
MLPDTPALRAYEAIGDYPLVDELADLCLRLGQDAAAARRGDWSNAEAVRSIRAERSEAAEGGTDPTAARTPFGSPWDVLERGPEDEAERALLSAIFARGVRRYLDAHGDELGKLAGDVLWLATYTDLDAGAALDLVVTAGLKGADGPFWEAIAERVRRGEARQPPPVTRGETLAGAALLADSTSPQAAERCRDLLRTVRDLAVIDVLRRHRGQGHELTLKGEILATPRSRGATVLLGITGLLAVMWAVRLLARFTVAFRRPAEISIGEGRVLFRYRVEMLGRVLKRHEEVLERSAIVRAGRDVRYPRLGFYTGLISLTAGSFVGLALVVDGLRAASPPLLLAGTGIVLLGIALDFGLTSLVPGLRGRCRLRIEPRSGRQLSVGGVEPERADEALRALFRHPALGDGPPMRGSLFSLSGLSMRLRNASVRVQAAPNSLRSVDSAGANRGRPSDPGPARAPSEPSPSMASESGTVKAAGTSDAPPAASPENGAPAPKS